MYGIQVYDRNRVGEVFRALQDGIAQDGRFTVRNLRTEEVRVNRKDRGWMGIVYAFEGTVYTLPTIILKGVRLTHKKLFCGQHAGECQTNPFTGAPPKKMNSTLLEYTDWIDFHNVVNRVLTNMSVAANVWTNPMEGGVRKMWVRKALQARVRYDYDTEYDSYGRAVHTWNAGTPDQF